MFCYRDNVQDQTDHGKDGALFRFYDGLDTSVASGGLNVLMDLNVSSISQLEKIQVLFETRSVSHIDSSKQSKVCKIIRIAWSVSDSGNSKQSCELFVKFEVGKTILKKPL